MRMGCGWRWLKATFELIHSKRRSCQRVKFFGLLNLDEAQKKPPEAWCLRRCDQINGVSWSIKDCQEDLEVHQVDLEDLPADRQADLGGHLVGQGDLLADRQADLAGHHRAEMDH